MRLLNPSTYFLRLGIPLMLLIACKEPVNEMVSVMESPPSLQQEIQLKIDGVTCIDDMDTTSCNNDTSTGSGTQTGLLTTESNYLFRAYYTLSKQSTCFSRPLDLQLFWFGQIPTGTFEYSLSNVDELFRNSAGHNFLVHLSVYDSERQPYYSHNFDLRDITPVALDPSATSEFTYSLTDTICHLRETSTLILNGTYEGYVYNDHNRPTDSLQIKFRAKDVIVGNRFY